MFSSSPISRSVCVSLSASPSVFIAHSIPLQSVASHSAIDERQLSVDSAHPCLIMIVDDGELTDADLLYIKEDNQRRVKRIVAFVGVTLTLVSIILVALSLSLGQKIDELGM